MKVSRLVSKKINIPFKVSFKHSSAAREKTQSVWIEATSDSGLTGYGEGCPREYVTNESIDSALAFFSTNKSAISDQVRDLESLTAWCTNHKNEIDKNPAAWCAIELALLDLMAKEKQCSTEQLIGFPEIKEPFHYTAVLGDAPTELFAKQLNQYIAMGFSDFKIKISGALDHDLAKFRLLKEHNDKNLRVRLDANNLWNHSAEAIDYLTSINYPIFALEEPLKTGDYTGLDKIIRHCNSAIILDESFLKIEDFEKISNPEKWIINLRISKMGGILRARAIADKAAHSGIKIIIGAQVGETSLLTRAALVIANAYRTILIAQEGAFGTLLLQTDVCEPPVMFGKQGLLNFVPKQKHGFQLAIQPDGNLFS